MNILIIGGAGHSIDANSVCVRNMAKEFLNKGHKVWILAMGDEYINIAGSLEGGELWHIPMDYYRRLTDRVSYGNRRILKLWFNIISFIRHILLLFFYPNTSPLREKKLTKRAISLVRDNNIQLILTIFTPYDNIYAGIKIKKIFGVTVKVVSYHLDLRTASISSSVAVRHYIYKHALSSLVDECKIVDKILIPYSGQKETENLDGLIRNKIRYVGFPVFIESGEVEQCELPFKKGDINISYIGTLSEDNRNPRYVLSLLEQLSQQMGRKVMVHFWGYVGNLEPFLSLSPIATYHGTVENRYVSYILSQSDFLLNIGNAIAYDMLPSKVFSLFATGKFIINVVTHPKDATIPYFKRYNNSVEIFEYCKSNEDILKLKNAIATPKCGELDHHLFDDFKPSSICAEIINS